MNIGKPGYKKMKKMGEDRKRDEGGKVSDRED